MAAQVRFGAKDLVYAVLTESTDVVGGTPSYGTPAALANLAKVSVNPNGNSAILFADDGPRFVADTIGKIDVTFDLADISTAALATVLGHTVGASGAITELSTDQSPYIAIGFKITRTGGYFDYMWLLKGKLTKPDISAETKKESINFQMQTLKGQFVALQANNAWRTRLRTDDAAVAAGTISSFFSAPVISSAADLGALTFTSIAAVAASAKTLVLTFGKAGGGSVAIANASAANIVVTLVSTGAIIPVQTFTAGAAGVAPTLTLGITGITAAAHAVLVLGTLQDTGGALCVPKVVNITPS